MADAVRVLPAALSHIPAANLPWVAIFGGVGGALVFDPYTMRYQNIGGMITNPWTAADQGLPQVETLFYSFTNDATPFESATCFPLQPGETINIPSGLDHDVSVCAASAGHRFTAFIIQPAATPPQPVPGNFPPSGPTTLLKVVRQYPYIQYQDDDDVQAFFRANNEVEQEYLDWFNQVQLPVYTSPLVAGDLLDWVAQGLYGMKRPILSSGQNRDIGPLNTAMYDEIGWNEDIKVGPDDVTVTTDDIFKRIMTWQLYRGDGKQFNLTWLKRRVVRFLNGPNGTDPVITNTYSVSAAYASRTQVNLILPNDPNSSILKQAIDSGAVGLPFQLTFSVTIAT